MRIGIIGGNGFVGKAMLKLFPQAFSIGTNTKREYIDECDTVFVCVPTNNPTEKENDMSIVEDVVSKSKASLIIIRSTLQPGTADMLEKKYGVNISVVPEYVGETVAHPLLDESARPFLVIGGKLEIRRQVIEIFQSVYNANITIRQVTNLEAEIVKLSENRAIAFKVAQCQELYDVCENAGIDYYTIRDAVYGDDPRFNLWWTFVFPDKRGFKSKCIPKDIYAWCAWAESCGYTPKITQAILDKNKEWTKTK